MSEYYVDFGSKHTNNKLTKPRGGVEYVRQYVIFRNHLTSDVSAKAANIVVGLPDGTLYWIKKDCVALALSYRPLTADEQKELTLQILRSEEWPKPH